MSQIKLVKYPKRYQLGVNSGQDLENFIRECSFSQVNENINSCNFPPPNCNPISSYQLVQFYDSLTGEKAQELLSQEGYQGAHLWALLDFVLKNPDLPRELIRIVALGSVWHNPKDNLAMVPLVGRIDSKLHLSLLCLKTDFISVSQFLVSKISKP